jgi:uncharacterized protein YecE (DUF72 family)
LALRAFTMRLHIGTSGWVYRHWFGRFYPPETKNPLLFYSSCFTTVELNASFYRLPTRKAIDRWRKSTPDGFLFSIKGSRYITHIRRLEGVEESLGNFLDLVRGFGDKLGPILWQLPPSMKRDEEKLSSFLALLPPDLLYSVEFRNDSWFTSEVLDMLSERGVALCISDMPGLSCPFQATAPFIYVRMHGPSSRYSSKYSEEELRELMERIRGLGGSVQDAYIYFNNDYMAYAVENAKELIEMAGLLNAI